LIAATNRGDSLDPALVRPGRFDRRLYFDVPTKQGRLDLIDYFLDRKRHHQQLDDRSMRERIAYETFGYTPVMIEHLFDEGLLVALREGRRDMNFDDVLEAKFAEEVGLKQPVVYTEQDREAVATHEAGHATVAHFVGQNRRLEVLSIIKRRASLGLLAHGDSRSASRAPAPRSRRASRSPWAAWWPRSSASATPAPVRRPTWPTPRPSRPAWWGPSAWRVR
jgi:ATP-dependent Zn protease